MWAFRNKTPVTLSLFLFGFALGCLLFLYAWKYFHWGGVLSGIFLGFGVTAYEILQYRKKGEDVYRKSKIPVYVIRMYIILMIVFRLIDVEDFYHAQLLYSLCIYLFTLYFSFRIYEVRSGNDGITWGDIE